MEGERRAHGKRILEKRNGRQSKYQDYIIHNKIFEIFMQKNVHLSQG
jgi:hypothetical protein